MSRERADHQLNPAHALLGVPVNRKSPSGEKSYRNWLLAGLCLVMATGTLATPPGSGLGTDVAAAAEPLTDGVAPTESEALAEAAASGQSVEVLGSRSEIRDVVANPDGTFTATEYTQPVRTNKKGVWVAIDPSLRLLPDGSVAPVATTVNVAFSGGGSGPLISVEKAGRSVDFGWDGALPVPQLDGPMATYSDVLPDVDLVVKATADGFSHTFVVKTAEAAANPELAQIDMPITADGAEIRTTEAGSVEIIDSASGGVMLEADTPAMWDSSASGAGTSSFAIEEDNTGRADVDVEVSAEALTLVPDQALLTGPGTTYPVYIDPIWGDRYRDSYAMVDSGYPSEEYWKFDGEPDEGLGLCPVSSGTCRNSKVKRLYYQFGSLPYSGKKIITAEFAVTLRFNWDGANTSDMAHLYKMSKTISTSTNWDNKPSGSRIAEANTPAPSGGSCALSTDHGTEFNIETAVQALADKGTKTLTLGLQNASESDSSKWMRFCPNGHLRVRYNSPPSQPLMGEMYSSPGKTCDDDPAVPAYVNKLPRLTATVRDPDSSRDDDIDSAVPGEQVKAEFKLVWGANDANTWQPLDKDGQPILFGSSTLDAKHPSAPIAIDLANYASTLNTLLPKDSSIGWIARAYDGYSYSSWSWSGEQVRCKFVWDTALPDPPVPTSAQFPSDGTWVDMVGEYGDITFTSTSLDVTGFTYEIPGETGSTDPIPATLRADGLAKIATISWMPQKWGNHTLTVRVRDAAGNPGRSANTVDYNIAQPGSSVEWALADDAGSSAAASSRSVDGIDTNPAVAGAGATFGVPGPGAAGAANSSAPTATSFDGSPNAYLTTTVRDLAPTSEGFAVSAWVNTDDLAHDQTAVSVVGGGEAGFTLGYDARSKSWAFAIPDYDIEAFTWFTAKSNAGVEAGEWAHLLGVYDAKNASMRLYVNGVDTTPAAGQAPKRGTWWNASGPVEIGRHYSGFGFTDNWNGDIAEVKVFDRVVLPDEASGLSTVTPIRQGYWQFNDEVVGNVSPEYTGRTDFDLTLAGNPTIYAPSADDVDLGAEPALVGEGHLALDGVDDAASTGRPVLTNSAGSFTFSTHVQLPTIQPGTARTVLSIPGTNTSLLNLRLTAEGAWEVDVAHEDTAGAARTVVSNPLVESQQMIAVVYDAFTDTLSLYVNGAESSTVSSPFQGLPPAGAGALQLGRSFAAGSGSGYFSGAIDDVRVYQGVVDATTLQRLAYTDAEQTEL